MEKATVPGTTSIEVVSLDDEEGLSLIRDATPRDWTFRGSPSVAEFAKELSKTSADRVIVVIDVSTRQIAPERISNALVGRRPPEMAFVFYSAAPMDELSALARKCGVDGYMHGGSDKTAIQTELRAVVDRISRPKVLSFGERLASLDLLQGNDQFQLVPVSTSNWHSLIELGQSRTVILDLRDPKVSASALTLIPAMRQQAKGALTVVGLDPDPAADTQGVNAFLSSDLERGIFLDSMREMLWVAPRREARVPVRIGADGRPEMLAFTRNVSASGLLVSCQRPLEIGQTVACRLELLGRQLTLQGRSVRRDERRADEHCFGIRFHEVASEDRVVLREYVLKYWAAQIVGLLD